MKLLSLIEMTVSGGALILAVMLVRVLVLDKLPKRAFLVLWALALPGQNLHGLLPQRLLRQSPDAQGRRYAHRHQQPRRRQGPQHQKRPLGELVQDQDPHQPMRRILPADLPPVPPGLPGGGSGGGRGGGPLSGGAASPAAGAGAAVGPGDRTYDLRHPTACDIASEKYGLERYGAPALRAGARAGPHPAPRWRTPSPNRTPAPLPASPPAGMSSLIS